jgi:hypothetical protein
LTKAKLSILQYLLRFIQLDLLKHVGPKVCHGRLCNLSPYFMTKVKDLVSMGI